MSGNKLGGLKARDANRKRYGEDYYAKVGKLGGLNYNPDKPKGFAHPNSDPRKAGKLGGMISRRGKSKKTIDHDKAKAEFDKIKEKIGEQYEDIGKIN